MKNGFSIGHSLFTGDINIDFGTRKTDLARINADFGPINFRLNLLKSALNFNKRSGPVSNGLLGEWHSRVKNSMFLYVVIGRGREQKFSFWIR